MLINEHKAQTQDLIDQYLFDFKEEKDAINDQLEIEKQKISDEQTQKENLLWAFKATEQENLKLREQLQT